MSGSGWRTVLLALLLATPTFAQSGPGNFPLETRLQILLRPHSVLALDAVTGGEREEPLGLGERVLSNRTDGRVGFVLTDQRILAIAVGAGSFQQTRYGRGESLTNTPSIGDRVALFVTTQRVLGFDGGSANLIETRLGVRERVLETAVADNVAIVLTSRRALGLSPFRGGFFEVPLGLDERIASLVATGDVATLTTVQRILIFRADTGNWEERQLGLGY